MFLKDNVRAELTWHDLPLYLLGKIKPHPEEWIEILEGKCSLEFGTFQVGWLPLCPSRNTSFPRTHLESSFSSLMPWSGFPGNNNLGHPLLALGQPGLHLRVSWRDETSGRMTPWSSNQHRQLPLACPGGSPNNLKVCVGLCSGTSTWNVKCFGPTCSSSSYCERTRNSLRELKMTVSVKSYMQN